MITITRNGLKLTCDADVIPAQGSSNVPVTFVNDDDEYASYIVQPSIGWFMRSGAFKATIAVFENDSFDIPAEAFLQDGQIYISIGLVDPKDANHIEKTLQLSLRCTPAPYGTVVLPSDDQWTKVVEDYMRELYDRDYKAQFDEIESDLNDLIDEAQDQQKTVSGLITSVNGLITETNEKIEEADTAITNANNATQSANTATSQANTARDQANSAAQSANSIAQQVQQKLENGDFVPDLKIGEVTTLSPGADATASIGGTSEDPVLNLGIPQGQQGEMGPKGDANPAGTILIFAGANAPDGYLLCQGQEVSRSTYSDLFNVIQTLYGAGDGSTTFNIPDLRSRVAVGMNSADTEFNALGKTVGAKEHQLSTNEIPSHSHSASASISSAGSHSHDASSDSAGDHSHTVTVNSGGAHTHTASSNSTGAHTHTVSGTAASAGNHIHAYAQEWVARSTSHTGVYGLNGDGTSPTYTGGMGSAGAHTHSISGTAASAGNHSHTITVNSGGSHSHSASSNSAGTHTHEINIEDAGSHSHDATVSVGNTGGGVAFNLIQPSLVMNYIIKY